MRSVINSFGKLLKRTSGGDFPASSSSFFSSPAPGSSSVSGRHIFCNPPASYPKTRQMSLSAKKFGGRRISYRNIIFYSCGQKPSNLTPILPQISNLTLTEAVLVFSLPRFHPSPDSQFPSIYPAFCYSIGIKNLIRRVQNDGIGILPVEPDNLPVYAAGGGRDFSVYEANWGESKAIP